MVREAWLNVLLVLKFLAKKIHVTFTMLRIGLILKSSGKAIRSLSALLLWASVLTSCYPNRIVHNLLEDQTTRARMYHEILKNETYRGQLMDSLRTNRHTRLLVNPDSSGKSAILKKNDLDN